MKVCEIFASIQGESSYAGLPCVFVRMTGCNLRCPYCDTKYAYEEGIEMSGDRIFEIVSSYGIRNVEFTGGEPLLHQGVYSLMSRLVENGFRVLLETNGSMDIKDVDKRVIIIMDIKTPNSGMFGYMNLDNIKYLKKIDEVKFVIMDKEDYEWVKDFMDKYKLLERCNVLLSPVHGILKAETLAGWIIGDRLSVSLNLQMHKYIFGHERRGV